MNSNDNNRNKGDDDINDKITRFGAVLIAIAVVVFCYAYTRLSLPSCIPAYVIAGLLAAIGAFIVTVVIVGSRAEKRNFFLYDKRSSNEKNSPFS